MSGRRKQKSKARLDKFYHLAKDSGYRSRAAFKLLQLNKKYNFLEKADSVVDLCCAPGSWLQVCEKYMPTQSVKIGVDLVKITPIPNCKTFQQDITKPECSQLILKEMQKNSLKRVDLVLNDGAPNVGASWDKDAYNQIELTLEAFKLATKVLRKGGTFVTKVFRSSDYQSLIWVLNKFFSKVEATKPEASRNQSAEIFVTCLEYLHPDYIDNKFFDSKYVFKDNEMEINEKDQEINSIEKLFQKRRKRQGYADDAPQNLYKTLEFEVLLNAANPYILFYEYNKVKISEDELQKYRDLGVKEPSQVVELLEDLQVLGKREVFNIIKWCKKIKFIIQKTRKNSVDNDDDGGDKGKAKGKDDEIDSDQELEKEIELQKKKEEGRKKKKEEKQLVKIARGKSASLNVAGADEDTELFSFSRHKKGLREAGFIDVEEDQVQEPENDRAPKLKQASQKEIEDNIEYLYDQKRQKDSDYKEKKKQEKIEKMSKSRFNQQEFDEQYIKAKQFMKEEDKKDILESMEDLKSQQAVMNKKWFDQQIFQDLKKKIGKSRQNFQNPLNKQKDSIDEDSEFNEDSEGEIRDRKKKKVKQELDMKLGSKVGDIEIVRKERQPEDYDLDELAENLALAKKMIRKKHRDNIIDSTYNRFSYDDDEVDLPKWFLEDEKQSNIINMPISKEEVQVQKERLMAINSRMPKKVLEAKWRKKIKLARKLKKAQQKAEAVFNQEELSQGVKMKQIRSIYRKEINAKKDQKKYIVGKAYKAGAAKGGRGVKFVDRKLKGDKKMEKKALKKKEKSFKIDPNRGISKKSKKIHKSRKNRK